MYRLAVLLGALVIALSSGVANASTALLLGGQGKYAKLTEEQMAEAFGGYFTTYDRRVNVPFPGKELYSSVKVGADNLYAAVYDPKYAGPKTIGGVSEGAPAVVEVLRRLEADRASGKENVPPPSELNVTIYGAPDKRFIGKLAELPTPVTPYDVIIVKAEYDGIADFPDNTWNFLAVSNAIMGAVQLHVKQSNFDIRGQETMYTIDYNDAGGSTTTILIPTKVLPILAPMVAFHFDPDFVASMDKMLRPIIDSAYNRPAMQTGIPPTLTGPPAPKPTSLFAKRLAAQDATSEADTKDAPKTKRSSLRQELKSKWKEAVARREERLQDAKEAREARKEAREAEKAEKAEKRDDDSKDSADTDRTDVTKKPAETKKPAMSHAGSDSE